MARALLAALTLGWTVVWVERAALSPVGPLVQAELALGYADLGLLSALGLLAGSGGYVLAGLASPRRPRLVLLGGLALLGVATLAASSATTWAHLAAAQAVAGAGEGLFYVPALALVAQAYRERGSGRALGTLDAGISAGSFLVLLGGGALATLLGWRSVFLAAGLLGLLVIPFVLAPVRPSPPPAPVRLRQVLARRALPAYASVTLGLVVFFALLYLSPALLVARGLTLPQADLLLGAAVAFAIPLHFLGGALADRFGPARSAALFTFLFAPGLAAVGLAPNALLASAALFASYGLGVLGFVGLIALVPRVLGADLAGPAFGVFWGIGYLGGAAGPFLVGAIADAWGFSAAFGASAVAAALGALVLLPQALSPRR